MPRTWLWLGLGVALVIGGCSGGEGWPKTAGETSCAEWLDKMTVDNRRGLAEAMLELLWEKDGAAETPPDAVALRFADAIGGTCAAYRNETVSKIGGSLYVLSSDIKPGSN